MHACAPSWWPLTARSTPCARCTHSCTANIAVASGADKPKVLMQLEKVGMLPYFGELVFSGHDLPRTKPWPDVYLAAATCVGISPQRCTVIEDAQCPASPPACAPVPLSGATAPESTPTPHPSN